MKNLTLEDIDYKNVKESFGMGGPYLGMLELKGKRTKNMFLADNEKYSQDHQFICLVSYKGKRLLKKKFLNFITYHKKAKDFRIILLNTQTEEIYESIPLGEALFVEKMQDKKIIYFEAFHNEIEQYKKEIIFNEHNFKKVEEDYFYK